MDRRQRLWTALVSSLFAFLAAEDIHGNLCHTIATCTHINTSKPCQRFVEVCPPCLASDIAGYFCMDKSSDTNACPVPSFDCSLHSTSTGLALARLKSGLTPMHIGYIVGVSVCALGITVFLFVQPATQVTETKELLPSQSMNLPKRQPLFAFLDTRRDDSGFDLTVLDSQGVNMTLPRHIPLLQDGDTDTMRKAPEVERTTKGNSDTPVSYAFSLLTASDPESRDDDSIVSWAGPR
ncbi:hypothetical protein Ae201684P_011465 [Aphanomyces euteiches]|nr:hypothetical protein Ae201684P_011465 [Aphanomyces euteiches]KAH9153093.1 hypothetical protein AeRB84_004590 [Aphanomyces euteiches]